MSTGTNETTAWWMRKFIQTKMSATLGRIAMLAFRCSTGTIAVAFAVFAMASAPAAAAKPTYEQAWAGCKAQLDRTVPGDQASARHSAGASCMKKYGFRLKK